MGSHKAVLWLAIGGLVALMVVTVAVQQPALRALLALLAVTPLLYGTIRIALGSEREVAQERRRYLKLRAVTDEFLMNVRNLNRLTVAAAEEDAPVDLNSQIDEVVERMHNLVERMRGAAGRTDEPGPEQFAGESEGS